MSFRTKSFNSNSGRTVSIILLFSSTFIREKVFLFPIYWFLFTIFITNCNANQVSDPNRGKQFDEDVGQKLSHLQRRDVNQESLPIVCNSDEECHQNILNTICRDKVCICNQGLSRSDNNTCIQTDSNVVNDDHNQSQDRNGAVKHDSSNETPKAKLDGTHMLPIMIVLGVMFIGMCVALNLFSRARFRQNRSIFSNPRLLKLGHSSTKSNTKRRISPPNPNTITNNTIVAETELPKNGSYVSIALDS